MPWLQLKFCLPLRLGRRLRRADAGAVGFMFAIAALPLALAIGLAVDYGFFIKIKAQLDMAADAAAMHAVRVASQTANTSQATTASVQQAGQVAGTQWFAAQAGSQTNTSVTPTVTVSYVASPSSFTATVTYAGSVRTYFGGLFNTTNFAVAGTATAAISTSYVEVLLLLDSSGSMLIGASLSDIVALEKATPCSTQGINEGQNMANYSWVYPGSYGYGSSSTAPPTTAVNGACDPNYTGDASACFYVTGISNLTPGNAYKCSNGGGSPATIRGVLYPNMPNAPCGFACHNTASNNDYYGLARSLNPPITLRLDVVQQAAADVATTLQTKQQAPGQFSIGVYQFTTSLQQLYPTSGSGEAGTNFTSASTIIQNTKNSPGLAYTSNSDFHAAATTLNALVTPAGAGTTPSQPKKYLFIVTDGMQDSSSGGYGPMLTATNDQYCSLFWNKGFQVYVLFTPYLPLPNPFYLSNRKQYAEPLSTGPDVVALQACARTSAHFFQASDPSAINSAMQTMLAAALNSAGRVSQ